MGDSDPERKAKKSRTDEETMEQLQRRMEEMHFNQMGREGAVGDAGGGAGAEDVGPAGGVGPGPVDARSSSDEESTSSSDVDERFQPTRNSAKRKGQEGQGGIAKKGKRNSKTTRPAKRKGEKGQSGAAKKGRKGWLGLRF